MNAGSFSYLANPSDVLKEAVYFLICSNRSLDIFAVSSADGERLSAWKSIVFSSVISPSKL